MSEKSCFTCDEYESSFNVTSGKGKKTTTRMVIGYCKVYKKPTMELSPFIKNNCSDHKEKNCNDCKPT